MRNSHVFEITAGVWGSLTVEEVSATVADMRELGLYRRPCAGTIVIRTPLAMPDSWHVEEATHFTSHSFSETIYVGDVGEPTIVEILSADRARNADELLRKLGNEGVPAKFDPERRAIILSPKDLDPAESAFTFDALVVLLASKGVEKVTKESKLASLGIGKSKPRFTTIISLSRSLPNEPSEHSGAHRRPHLRRGHIRRQHHGKNNELVKTIWIDPTFINGDASFFETRTQYRITR